MEQLRAADLDFYGSDSSGWSDSSASADDDEFPPAKRTRAASASQLPPLAALALPMQEDESESDDTVVQKPAVQVATAMPTAATSQLKSVTSNAHC